MEKLEEVRVMGFLFCFEDIAQVFYDDVSYGA